MIKPSIDRLIDATWGLAATASGTFMVSAAVPEILRNIKASKLLANNTWEDYGYPGCGLLPDDKLWLNGAFCAFGAAQAIGRGAGSLIPAIYRLVTDTTGSAARQAAQGKSEGHLAMEQRLGDELWCINASEAGASLLFHVAQGYLSYKSCNANGIDLLVNGACCGISAGVLLKAFVSARAAQKMNITSSAMAVGRNPQDQEIIRERGNQVAGKFFAGNRPMAVGTMGLGLVNLGAMGLTAQSMSQYQVKTAMEIGYTAEQIKNIIAPYRPTALDQTVLVSVGALATVVGVSVGLRKVSGALMNGANAVSTRAANLGRRGAQAVESLRRRPAAEPGNAVELAV